MKWTDMAVDSEAFAAGLRAKLSLVMGHDVGPQHPQFFLQPAGGVRLSVVHGVVESTIGCKGKKGHMLSQPVMVVSLCNPCVEHPHPLAIIGEN